MEFYKLKSYVLKPILILDPVYENITNLINDEAVLTISNLIELKKVLIASESANKVCKVFLALNTGMNRFGFKTKNELNELISVLKKTQKISVLGVFSHYFNSKDKIITNSQNFDFEQKLYFLNDFLNEKTLISISASAGIKNDFPENLVRIGMGNYTDSNFQTIELSSKVIEIQKLSSGETAGYDGVFVAKKNSKVAVVGIGYGDGIFRNILKNGYVLINKSFCKIVAVCMDTILVDVSSKSVKVGDKVTLIGSDGKNQIFICDVAKWCDTISYEILVRLSERIERQYEVNDANYNGKV